MTATAAPPPAAGERGGDVEACKRWTLRIVCLSTALLLLNVAGPNVALQEIATDLEASFTDLQWVLSGYALALEVFLLTAGTLADRYGRRRLFLIGLGLFSVASLLCAAAPGSLTLVFARILQGAAAAVIFPASLALLAQEFQGPDRRRAIGIWGATIGLAFAAGPLIGGFLVDFFGWRAVFAFNVVFGLPAIALGLRRLRESRDPAAKPIDWPGVITLSLALFLIVFAVLRGNALGWTSGVIVALLTAGFALIAAFLYIERRHSAPMLELDLFRNRTFSGASIVVGLMAGATFGIFTYLTLFLLNVQGRGPVETGLVLAPLAVVSFIVSAAAGRANQRVPLRGAIVLGLVVTAFGLLVLHGLEVGSSPADLMVGLVIVGAGIGLVNPLATFAHLSVLPPAYGGLASALNNTARQLGLAVGIAALGAMLQASVRHDFGSAPGTAGQNHDQIVDKAADGDLAAALAAAPAGARSSLSAAYNEAFTSALDDLLLLAIAVNVVAAVAALMLVSTRDLWRPPAPAEG